MNQGPTTDQRLLVDTSTSKLEAEIHVNAAARPGAPGLLIVHPHSVLGGSMQDYVVQELFRNASTNPEVAAVLRYNQRGVGKSTGSKFAFKNLKGQLDAGDVLEMVEFLAKQLEAKGNPAIVVIGYSFGAHLASYALTHPAVKLYVGISFPLGGLSRLVQTKEKFQLVCSATHVERLLVIGTDDQYTKLQAITDAVKAAGGEVLPDDSSFGVGAGGPGAGAARQQAGSTKKPLLLKVFPMNDHFWGNDGAAMAEFVVSYAVSAISGS